MRVPPDDARNAREHLLVEARQVPAQVAVDLTHSVGKTMHDVELDAVALDDPGDDAATRRAEVDRGEDAGCHGN